MAEKIGYGENREAAVIRTPVLRFEITRWDWTQGKARDKKPLDITFAVFQFRWMKSTRNPESGCEIAMVPQFSDLHYLDSLETMDVVSIYEFNILKYRGFIRRIGARGTISANGSPNRQVVISCASFGALFSEGQLGVNMFLKSGTFGNLSANIKAFSGKIADLVKEDKPYSELVGSVVDEWLSFLAMNGADKYSNYFSTWINYKDGLAGKTIPGIPKDLYLFYGTEQSITLWSVLTKLIQAPFNELWFDSGPRKVWVENNENLSPAKPGEIDLSDEKEYLIIRNPPFNGTVIDGAEIDLWDSLPSRVVPLNYLTRFDLNKSMDESLSFYLVAPAVYNPGELGLVASGKYAFDTEAFNKYLYRPTVQDLFFTRIQKPESVDVESKAQDIYKDADDKAKTLLNWNKNNDRYLSGSVTLMVPSNDEMDPRIGDKLELEGIADTEFYVEGVSHSWTYGGALTSDVAVTRGWGKRGPIELKDKIFKRGKFIVGGKFS